MLWPNGERPRRHRRRAGSREEGPSGEDAPSGEEGLSGEEGPSGEEELSSEEGPSDEEEPSGGAPSGEDGLSSEDEPSGEEDGALSPEDGHGEETYEGGSRRGGHPEVVNLIQKVGVFGSILRQRRTLSESGDARHHMGDWGGRHFVAKCQCI